jgi:hypothetical protein
MEERKEVKKEKKLLRRWRLRTQERAKNTIMK